MCGIVGMVSGSAVNQQLYDALTVLQHRGQDAAGIVTCDGESLPPQRQRSRQRRVPPAAHAAAGRQRRHRPRALSDGRMFEFGRSAADVRELALRHHARAQRQSHQFGSAASATCSAKTCGTSTPDATPRCCSTCSRTSCRRRARTGPNPSTSSRRSRGVHERCRGAYAAVAMVIGVGIVGFRDPIRHPAAGVRQARRPAGTEYMIASESVALDILGFELIRDVAPGECVYVSAHGELATRVCAESRSAYALHLRARVPRPAGLDHGSGLGLQVPIADGRKARRPDRLDVLRATNTTSTW